MSARFYVRTRNVGLGSDDWLCLAALVCSVISIALRRSDNAIGLCTRRMRHNDRRQVLSKLPTCAQLTHMLQARLRTLAGRIRRRDWCSSSSTISIGENRYWKRMLWLSCTSALFSLIAAVSIRIQPSPSFGPTLPQAVGPVLLSQVVSWKGIQPCKLDTHWTRYCLGYCLLRRYCGPVWWPVWSSIQFSSIQGLN